jgi:hypothetical protein
MSNGNTIKYGLDWGEGASELEIEFTMLQKRLWDKGPGSSPLEHYLAIDRILWPEDDQHRWFKLAFKALCENTITTLMGCADSGKTYPTAKWGLIEYWSSPKDTLVIVSSTDARGLELRVWGAMKDLYNRAIERVPYLPGVVLESAKAITTDTLSEDNRKARVLRKGIVCIPCMISGRFVGLGKYVGVKQKRIRQIGDEVQFMGPTFLEAIPNYLGKDYQAAFLGNPLEPTDCLGRLAEPLDGWENQEEPEKTSTWKTRFHGGICVNLVGTDSPNFDYPRKQKIKYPYMISWKKIESTIAFYGKDSIQYYSQCKGVMRFGLVGKRVITSDMCKEHGAHGDALWLNTSTTKLYALDPAYGGEDRCVGCILEFGLSNKEQLILKVHPPEVIPVKPGISKKPEMQIAEHVKMRMDAANIPPTHCFYDSTGKGTLGESFAVVFGNTPPVAVDSGGKPTSRPVRHDLFIVDEQMHGKRLKRCDEHYSKFITEMWFSVRTLIECNQMRELPVDVMLEGCLREYMTVRGNKIEVEPKDKTRERMGRSPDLFDCLAIGVEGARQLGFEIKSLSMAFTEGPDGDLDDELSQGGEAYDSFLQKNRMQHV